MRRWDLGIVLSIAAGCAPADTDGDNLPDADEIELGTDPEKADSDGDGIADDEELDLGTDPLKADSDDDGLPDGAERDLGTNPLLFDTDGDGLNDFDEGLYGKDPLDPASGPYKAGWPLQTPEIKKEVAQSGSRGTTAKKGDTFPRLRAVDQRGETVDLFDFARQGRNIILDISAEWCPPCRDLAEGLEGEGPLASATGELRKAINQGKLYWVTIIVENNANGAPDAQVVKDWFQSYKNKAIPVLADEEQKTMDYIIRATGGFPSVAIVDEDMKVLDFYSGYSTQTIDEWAALAVDVEE